ncbi:hypothetical protein H6P81_018136 [Aristolochia fimbriata]|uniref:S-acyltransferase n=1 Tax=Aristolochia fimbriata TaxID=158543 RepID=A0AAV7E0I8_ARIFI|nr:hypothetical protein H6P81_018136 [Aristolochia fimbriata]
MEEIMVEQNVASMPEGFEAKCWGCSLRLLLPSYSPVFKCGWCGALTYQNQKKHERYSNRWRYIRDRIFVTVVILFMLFVIGGGVWAVYPVIFSVSLLCGVLHSTISFILAASTLSSFWLAAFRSPGTPPNVLWGSYPIVDRGTLEDYTLCAYCAKPKSPRTHHCRSCGMCVLDMDHHCPFIGNCVGAANHRSFIAFLFSVIISAIYASVMSIYAGIHIWPPLDYGNRHPISYFSRMALLGSTSGITRALLSSALHLSARGIVLVYLFLVCTSVQIGLSFLLWQQLTFIYMGHTYISHISSSGSGRGQKGLQNLLRFFGCPYSVASFFLRSNAGRKSHWTFPSARALLSSSNAGRMDVGRCSVVEDFGLQIASLVRTFSQETNMAAFQSVPKLFNPLQSPSPQSKPLFRFNPTSRINASSKKDEFDQHSKRSSGKGPKTPRRRLITVSTSDGRWHGKWTDDYVFSLRELRLGDLAEEGQKDVEVFITLSVQKCVQHVGFGFSVEGRIVTAFTRRCSNCLSSYCRKIDTTFNVWVLPASRSNPLQLPDIGDDPSVIYVKPGSEADLDSLIQDTIRLASSVKDTCSESCEKAPPRLQYIGRKETCVDTRWSRLLELRKST